VALSNGATIQTSYAYDPYGVTTSAGAATTNTYQFTGRENDGTTAGLMYYRARYYNPAWGRFVSEDPIGVAGGVNLYGYVGEQPTGAVDPFGFASGPLNFGNGYSGRLDPFSTSNGPSFEIHVYDPNGNEVGVYGPDEWIKKHGFTGAPEIPDDVENAVRGNAIDYCRRAGIIPPKGNWDLRSIPIGQILRMLGRLGLGKGVPFPIYIPGTFGNPDRM
jgi:RHS repeat-associated protein